LTAYFRLENRMSTRILSFDKLHRLGESATGAIAHFSGPLAALLLLAECSLPRRRALPDDRKNAHSRLSN
jgi:hypothetical protein